MINTYKSIFTGRWNNVSGSQLPRVPIYFAHSRIVTDSRPGDCPDHFHHLHFVCYGTVTWHWPGGTMKLLPGNAHLASANGKITRCKTENCDHYYLIFRYICFNDFDLLEDLPIPACLGGWNQEFYDAQWRQLPVSLSMLATRLELPVALISSGVADIESRRDRAARLNGALKNFKKAECFAHEWSVRKLTF